MPIRIIKRLNNGLPIISKIDFTKLGLGKYGANINGPCLIKIPDWVKTDNRVHPLSNYYLYFSHHRGASIRLAWSEEVAGPWSLYAPSIGITNQGVLQLNETLGQIEIDNNLILYDHFASPQVVIDSLNKRFMLYFHTAIIYSGKKIGQKTLVAHSQNGISFSHSSIIPQLLGESYFSTFQINEKFFAFSNFGHLYENIRFGSNIQEWVTDFPFKESWIKKENYLSQVLQRWNLNHLLPRHISTLIKFPLLHVVFSSRGDCPERIWHLEINISETDPLLWTCSTAPKVLLEADSGWEGGQFPAVVSKDGYSRNFQNELRDPYLFEDDDQVYLLYAGGGEKSIGMAAVQIL